MDISVEAVVNTAIALEGATAQQNQQMLLLRKSLDAQVKLVQEIIPPAAPTLATSGSVGTMLHTTA